MVASSFQVFIVIKITGRLVKMFAVVKVIIALITAVVEVKLKNFIEVITAINLDYFEGDLKFMSKLKNLVFDYSVNFHLLRYDWLNYYYECQPLSKSLKGLVATTIISKESQY